MGWRPLSRRYEVGSDCDALHEGVRPWLKGTLLEWLSSEYTYVQGGRRIIRVALLRETERCVRRLVLGVGPDTTLLRTAWSRSRPMTTYSSTFSISS